MNVHALDVYRAPDEDFKEKPSKIQRMAEHTVPDFFNKSGASKSKSVVLLEEWINWRPIDHDQFGRNVDSPRNVIDRDAEKNSSVTSSNLRPAVKISSLLTKGSILFFGLCVASLVMWGVSAIPIFNPYMSLLGLVAAPFAYLMGHKLETNGRQ